MNRIDLTPQIVDRLQNAFSMVVQNNILRRGVCPDCGKKTLWTWLDKPGRVQCDRTNNCNYSATTKDLFPDLYERINDKYKATNENPNATADAYLSLIRSFNTVKIKGWYEQGKYWHPNGDKGTATVRFFLDADKTIMWERFIEDVTITDEDGDRDVRNKNFKGAFKGYWWQPPNIEINKGDEVWLVEGILDAIALNLNGIKAVAMMSSGTFPEQSLKPHFNKNITWILALDNDATGRRCLQKHAKRLRDLDQIVTAALSSSSEEKSDWNDLHIAKKLTIKDITEYRYLGRVELATSYRVKANLIWDHNKNKNHFIFNYRNRTYSARIDKAEFDKAKRLFTGEVAGIAIEPDAPDAILDEMAKAIDEEKQLQITERAFFNAAKIFEIATFKMDFLYFQQPDNGEDGQYFFRFNFANNAPEQQLPFTGKTFGASGDFKKAAMHKAPGAQFTGSTKELDILYRDWTSYIPKIVRTLDFIGYDKDSKAYVFNDYAVQDGRIIKLNNESFFQLKKSGIKTLVDIRQRLTTKHNHDWVGDYLLAFGIKGVVALAWWFGCLFVEQVRNNYRSYPFFEVVGEPGSGKSDMVDFLWKLLGKEGESFNPNISTLAGRTRKMAEVANLPVVFNETDNEQIGNERHQKRFNWDEQKDLYDGEFGRVTGIKTQDNSTKKPFFKSGLMAVQNIPIQASEAILTRICHLNFDRSHHSMEGKYASDRLNMLPVTDVSGFLLNAVKQSDRVMKHFAVKLKKYRSDYQKINDIKLQRIIENHAKIAAFLDCLKGVVPEIPDHIIDTAQQQIEQMAIDRQESLNEDHPVVQQFWAQYDYMNSRPEPGNRGNDFVDINRLNHSHNPDDQIAVNLEDFHRHCREQNQQFIDNKDLRRNLPNSKKRKYLRNEPIRSVLEKRIIRCWIFERQK